MNEQAYGKETAESIDEIAEALKAAEDVMADAARRFGETAELGASRLKELSRTAFDTFPDNYETG